MPSARRKGRANSSLARSWGSWSTRGYTPLPWPSRTAASPVTVLTSTLEVTCVSNEARRLSRGTAVHSGRGFRTDRLGPPLHRFGGHERR